MTLVRRVSLATIGAALLLVAGLPAPATAAPRNPTDPNAVTVAASAVGKTVTIRLTNNHSEVLPVCGVFLYPDPNFPASGAPQNTWGPVDIEPGQTQERVIQNIPMRNGNYHVYWNCSSRENSADVWWGTAPSYQTISDVWTPTAQPTPVVVDAPTCLGPICLPRGLGI